MDRAGGEAGRNQRREMWFMFCRDGGMGHRIHSSGRGRHESRERRGRKLLDSGSWKLPP